VRSRIAGARGCGPGRSQGPWLVLRGSRELASLAFFFFSQLTTKNRCHCESGRRRQSPGRATHSTSQRIIRRRPRRAQLAGGCEADLGEVAEQRRRLAPRSRDHRRAHRGPNPRFPLWKWRERCASEPAPLGIGLDRLRTVVISAASWSAAASSSSLDLRMPGSGRCPRSGDAAGPQPAQSVRAGTPPSRGTRKIGKALEARHGVVPMPELSFNRRRPRISLDSAPDQGRATGRAPSAAGCVEVHPQCRRPARPGGSRRRKTRTNP